MLAALLIYVSLLIDLTLAGPRFTSIFASKKLTSVPNCASTCLGNFISSSFPTSLCPNQEDLFCLCTSNSLSGFTLGEGALECVVASCPDASVSEYQAAYAVCSNIPDAAPETHGTLSASMASPSTILLGTHGSSSSSANAISTSSGISTSATPSLTAFVTDTAFPSSATGPFSVRFTGTSIPATMSSVFSMNLASATGTVPSAQAASSTAIAAHPVLSAGQVVGIAVGGGVLLLVALGLLFFIFCGKRRKEKKRDSVSSFGGDEIIGASPMVVEKGPTLPSPNPLVGKPNYVSPKAQQILGPDTNRWSLWQRPARPNDIGLAITPRPEQGFVQDASPSSIASYQTTSRLLPDKPIYAQVPAPSWRPLPPSAMASAVSRKPVPQKPVRFADGVGLRVVAPTPPQSGPKSKSSHQSPHSSPDSAQSGPIINRQPSDPFLRPPEDTRTRANPIGLRRASRLDLPRLKTDLTQGTASGWDQRTPPSLSRPTASYNPAEYARVMAPLSQPPVWKPSTHPAPQPRQLQQPPHNPYFLPQPQYTPYNPSDYSTEPTTTVTFNKYAPIKPSTSRTQHRPLTYLTTGSETSFEDDNDPDDLRSSAAWPIPASLGPVLSPVAESPRNGPPQPRPQPGHHQQPQFHQQTSLSQIRYPPIPRKPSSKKTLRRSPGKPSTGTPSPNPSITPPTPNAPLSRPTPGHTPSSLKRKPAFVLPAWDSLPANAEFESQASESECDAGPYELDASTYGGSSERGRVLAQPMTHLERQRMRGEMLLRQQREVPQSGSPGANENIRGTARWRVLCSPGEEGADWRAPAGRI